ncbi:hypothetical protein VSS74_27945 [Conexibacter stalactiti]|uniref:Uncharacterized protein n=1 Tax=Conexibacter stalactiti TaxID=1940611 RepID=A0ABU4HZU6_9ACTN|nr:hypothetical protein [Conexibacter stalactiti]MDW5598222.1 hypothetical protein [Conexibacter stalactiti]MEC5038864.1 hypothetical protein [Conexibacter stalactiti]
MADRIMCVTWGRTVPGREARALEVFNDAVAYYTGLREEGRIERFDLVILTPNGTEGGMMLLHGSHTQLDAVKEDDRFERIMVDAGMVVENLRLLDGYVNEGIAEPMGRFQDAIAHLPHPVSA